METIGPAGGCFVRKPIDWQAMDAGRLCLLALVKPEAKAELARREATSHDAFRVLASLTELAGAIGARMEPVPIPWDCADGFFEAHWRRPEAYLDENVRRGVSVWDGVGPEAEQRAVHTLRDDLASGRWAERNRDLVDLGAAELGARLLIA